MAVTTRRRLTLDEFLARPETKPASEYACGEVIRKPMPTWSHATIQGFLLLILGAFLSRTRLGRAVPEFRCIFGPPGGERTFVPDISYISQQRLTGETYFMGAPDLAIEILSPRQRRARFMDKVQFYLLYGVRLVWVIDPMAREALVLAPGQEPFTLTAADTLDGGSVLPGFSVPVGDIFAQVKV